jgi:hypothetical protein
MATKVVKDYRRRDQRRYIYQPYWISSAEVRGLDIGSDESKVALCFSFPAAQYGSSIILIEKCVIQIVEAFAGGTVTVEVGSWTLATDLVTDGGVATIVDVDDYIESADVTHGTPGYYFAATGDWITAKLLKTEGAVCRIVPADSTVPAIGVDITTDGTLTGGKCRLHFLITEIPIVA